MMKDQHKLNIEEALQTIAKLEILLKMVGVQERDLNQIQEKLWSNWKAYYDDSKEKGL